jgi:uracil-DNA glycosylase
MRSSANKPLPVEIKTCNSFLHAELAASHSVRVLFALGLIAHEAVLRSYNRPTKSLRFAHGAEHDLGAGRVMIDSYHCSRYNTSTRRLTPEMFETVVARARALADAATA